MLKKYSKHIAVFLAAAGMFCAGSQVSDATVIFEQPAMAPYFPFWPTGNSIGKGKLKAYPEIVLGVTYNDNIYLDEIGEESDVITSAIPRIRIDYSLEGRGHIRIGYSGNFSYYADFSDNDWQRHELALQLDYNAPSGLFLDLNGRYVDTEDPFGSESEYSLGQQKGRWFSQFGVVLGYNYDNRFKLAGFFHYNQQEYDNTADDWRQDYEEPWYGIGIEKRLSQKTWGFVRYFHGERDYTTASPGNVINESNDADYSYDWVETGLTWDAASRITGEINFGYEWREYDNPVDAGGNPFEDNNTWLASTRINYSIKPEVTNLYLQLERGSFQRGSGTIESYDGTYLVMMLNHRFYTWFKLLLDFGIGRNEYNNDREDDDIRAGIALEYLVWRRITLALGYDYTRRDSTEPGESFETNRVLGSVTVRY